MTTTNDDETALRSALARRRADAFECLVIAYQDRLYRFALRLSASPRDAEEIAQDTFVHAYRALAEYSRERVEGLTLRPWLYQITLNVVRNRARRHRVRAISIDRPERSDAGVAEPGWDLADRSDGPEATTLRREQTRDLSALLADLPERYRPAVILRHVEGLSYGELATVLGQPIGTVKANVHRGVQLLRVALAEQREEVSR